MRIAAGLTAVFLLSACASQAPEATTTACQDPRPQVCTLQYEPTCAVLAGGERKEYASPCNACADDQVTAFETGPCPE